MLNKEIMKLIAKTVQVAKDEIIGEIRKVNVKQLRNISDGLRKSHINERGLKKFIAKTINQAEGEIIDEFHKVKGRSGRPTTKSGTNRGPKNTPMMKIERQAVEEYLEIECHRPIYTCQQGDAYRVWNMPDNKDAFDAAAIRKDSRRGYPDHITLANAVLYWYEKQMLKKPRK